FSRMLAEHVRDGRMFYTNVWQMLARGGVAVHFFPTLYALPFLVNWLTPEVLANSIANVLTPRDKYQHAKFPAYYSWCRGPIHGQLRRLVDLGFDIIEYKGFFGHPGYYRKVIFLKRLHELKTNYLLKRPNPLFTSYAYVVLKKP
ncbi:MAG: class I SAM-dependent methyltransferase, partial [Bacteroidota bacterium]